MRKTIFTLFLICLLPALSRAQERISVGGYISDMPSLYHLPVEGWLWQNQLQNRINVDLYPNSRISVGLQMRNRFIAGSRLLVPSGPASGDDPGWLDMTLSGGGSLNDQNNYSWSMVLDRAWVEMTLGKFVLKAGRQRINWGQTFVWNPNDIFNSYSFFEIDYPERPGSDALLLQYYTGEASDIEVAVKADSSGRITSAGYFRFNLQGFDIQVLGGIISEDDMVAGLGWSGSLAGLSFRGEGSYFRSLENFRDTTGRLMFSCGVDYLFPNSLDLQGEFLYSGFAEKGGSGNLLAYYSGNLDVRKTGFTPWSFYTGISYPLTPLLNGSLSAMFMPDWKGVFIGPALDLSVSDNLYLSLIGQYFTLEALNPFSGARERQNFLFAFLRAKWNF